MIRINLHPTGLSPRSAKSTKWTLTAAAFLILLLVGSLSRAHETIIGGDEAKPGEYPAVVSLRASSSTADPMGTVFMEGCSGFLVHPKLILTAAHCLVDRSNIEWITNRLKVSGGPGRTFREDHFASFPGYVVPSKDRTTSENLHSVGTDIGYIRLRDEVPTTEIVPLPLYTTEVDVTTSEKLLNLAATIVGYGPTKFEPTGVYPDPKDSMKHIGHKTIGEANSLSLRLPGDVGGGLPGDSGGPILAEIDGQLRVVAIDESYIPGKKTVPILDRSGKPKTDRHGNPKTEEVDAYVATLGTPLTHANLCWVVKDSGIAIPGIDCTQ